MKSRLTMIAVAGVLAFSTAACTTNEQRTAGYGVGGAARVLSPVAQLAAMAVARLLAPLSAALPVLFSVRPRRAMARSTAAIAIRMAASMKHLASDTGPVIAG